MRPSILHRIERRVAESLRGDDAIVLAISGGVDSMVLLDAAARTLKRDRLSVATFDHGTGLAARDAVALVRGRADALGIECVSARATGPLRSEAALREARWRFLRSTADARKARVATAHTVDDQIETVLMRVLRGAGARGIAGLFASSDVSRPLLAFSRREVLRYARARGLDWIEDPSNASLRFLRNRVRHELLPALRVAHSDLDAWLLDAARAAAHWRADVTRYVDVAVAPRVLASVSGVDVSAAVLAPLAIGELRVLWPEIAARVGLALDRRAIERLADFAHDARVGARVQVSGGWQVIRSRDAFQLRASGLPPLIEAALDTTAVTRWDVWNFRPIRGEPAGDAWAAWLPGEGPLVVRGWLPGDAMVVGAQGQPRKVKYFLSDAGITGHERARWPVVLSGNEIIWIPGVRRSTVATARSGRPALAFACEHISR